jgi:AcrR family transcriptional regulator
MDHSQVVADARKMPKQARSRALVEAILDATARILVEDGFARTTTNRVAERAGVSIGSLYQYFPSREALVAAVARRHSERLKATLQASLADGSANLQAAIERLLEAIIRAHQVAPELTAVLSGEVPRLGALDWKAGSTRRGIALARLLIDRHADEVRPGLDQDAAAFICSTCVEGVMNAAARQAPTRIVDGTIAQELLALLLGYLRNPVAISDR